MQSYHKGTQLQRSALVLNYSGDFLEAYNRLKAGGPEFYFAQRYTVDSACRLKDRFEDVTIVDCKSDHVHETRLDNGILVIGLGLTGVVKDSEIVKRIRRLNPTHIFLRFVHLGVLYWAIKKCKNVFVISPTSIVERSSLKGWVRKKLFLWLLNSKPIQCISVYGIDASKTFAKLGVKPSKIVPHDYFYFEEKVIYEPKPLPDQSVTKLVFIGYLTEPKGIADVISAVDTLNKQGVDVRLSIVGKGSGTRYQDLVTSLKLDDKIHFAGMLENDKLEDYIRQHDALLVPSHHSYPEGFPIVISHALRARVPVLASDHPMFRNVLIHKETALVSKAGDASSIAENILLLRSDKEFYRKATENAPEVLKNLRLPVQVGEVFDAAFNGPDGEKFLKSYSLAEYDYDAP